MENSTIMEKSDYCLNKKNSAYLSSVYSFSSEEEKRKKEMFEEKSKYFSDEKYFGRFMEEKYPNSGKKTWSSPSVPGYTSVYSEVDYFQMKEIERENDELVQFLLKYSIIFFKRQC